MQAAKQTSTCRQRGCSAPARSNVLLKAQTPRRAAQRGVVLVRAAMKPQIMVNSCTGKMGQAVGEAVLRAGLEFVPFTLCGPGENAKSSTVHVGGKSVELVPPEIRDNFVEDLKKKYPALIMVDYTLPDCIHQQVDFYIKHRTPFVMGTTGGDRAALAKSLQDAKLHAIMAPNMSKQIVAFQAMMEFMSHEFPGCFSGYKLAVVESHQSSKKDTSGTAKAVVESFNGMGCKFDVSQIELVRTPAEQAGRMKVPESALLGHAFHTYSLTSGDQSVYFEFQHNVVGRTTYAEGTVDACLFLASQVEKKSSQTLFNMVDVLKAGAMR